MKFQSLLAVALVTIAAAFPAHAEGLGEKEAQALNGNIFTKLDTNKDGKLDSAELYPLVKHHFKKADKNQDGVVDKEEIGAMEANALIQLQEF